MRTWGGAVRLPDVDRYLSYQSETGIAEYRRSPGNLGALPRDLPGRPLRR
jgi:hypothetical protein